MQKTGISVTSSIVMALSVLLLWLAEYTGIPGFFYVYGFIAILVSFFMMLATVVVLFGAAHKPEMILEISSKQADFSKLTLALGRIFAISVIVYLVFSGHFVIAAFNVITLLCGFVVMAIIGEAKDLTDAHPDIDFTQGNE